MPVDLIPYVRRGLLAEFGSGVDVLGDALEGEEPDQRRLDDGLAQLDYARELLDSLGVAGHEEAGVSLLVSSPRAGRLLLDALRAARDVEVQRLEDAATVHVTLPSRDIPGLRAFVVSVERRLGRAAAHAKPVLERAEKRSPRPVRAR